MPSAAIESALNRPVWSALTTGDRRFAQGGPLALRFPPDIAPFGATVDESPEALRFSGRAVSPDGRVALVRLDRLKPYPGLEVVREAPIIQMVAEAETPTPSGSSAHRARSGRRPGDAASRAADEPRPVRPAHARAWPIHRRPGRRRARRHGRRAHAARRRGRDQRGLCQPRASRAKAMRRFSWPGSSESFARRALRRSCTSSRTSLGYRALRAAWICTRRTLRLTVLSA